jgi:hypothetical protein
MTTPSRESRKQAQKYRTTKLAPIFGFSPEEIRRIKLTAHLSLTDLAEGRGDGMKYGDVLSRILLGRELAFQFFSIEAAEYLHKAMNAVVNIYYECVKKDEWSISHDQRQELGDAIAMVDDMHEHLSRKEYFKVQDWVLAKSSMETVLASDLPWELYLEWRETTDKKHGKLNVKK